MSEEVNQIIAANSGHREQTEKLKALLDTIITTGGPNLISSLQTFIEAVMGDNLSLVVSRQVVSDVAQKISILPDSIAKEVGHHLLSVIQPRVISYEEQAAAVRQHLADVYEKESRWREAAKVLVGIPLETGQRQYPPEYKMKTYLRIAQLYLEDSDAVEAETYVNRASLLQAECKSEQLLILYKAQYARVLDYRRKFIEAAQRYYELSLKEQVAQTEAMQSLQHALVCTILASAGQQRSRMLATLFKD